MSKQSQKAEFNTFVQGIITEASPLNFPPNASVDEENFELNRDGTRQRRRGFSFEPGYSLITAAGLTEEEFNTNPLSSYKWTDVAGDSSQSFLVVQIKNYLYFFDMNALTLSTDGYINLIKIDQFPIDKKFSFTDVDGVLVVAAGVDKIAIVSATRDFIGPLPPGGVPPTQLSVEYQRLTVRDLWGIAVEQDEQTVFSDDRKFVFPSPTRRESV